MPEIKEIIWDADNTIWNWVRYAAVAYPAMAEKIAEQTGKNIEAVEHGMKAYYTRTGTIESPWLIQDLQRQGFFDDLGWDQSRIDQLREDVHSIFKKKRWHFLRMYRGVGRILKVTHGRGIKNHIVTDAPTIQACMRVNRSKIAQYLSSVHALRFQDHLNEPPENIQQKEAEGAYDVPFDVFELDDEKPDTRLENIIHALEETHGNLRDYIQKHVAIVGDNPKKDMALARKYGCLGIHAAWGTPTSWELEILARYAPEKVVKKNTTIGDPESDQDPNIISIKKGAIKREVLQALEIPPFNSWKTLAK